MKMFDLSGTRRDLIRRCSAPALAACLAIAAFALIAAPRAGAVYWTPAPPNGNGPVSCDAPSPRLAPGGAFTFIFRVQTTWDVETLGKMSAYQPSSLPLRSRDIFLVRSREGGPAVASSVVDHLTDRSMLSGEQLRCNRIMSLTGASTDPLRTTEYFKTLANDPRVWAVAPDWERPMFQLAYPGGAQQWTHDFATNVSRLRYRAAHIHAAGKSAGVVATGAHSRNGWDFGQLAKQTKLDNQVVQIQPNCVTSPASFASRARGLIHQYRAAGQPLSSLAVEVSFASDPGATSWTGDVSPERAARCVKAAHDAGIRSVLLWAQPDTLGRFFAALPNSVRG